MLQINSLSKRFGDVLALDDCSFQAHRGRMMGFLGPNGAGKTTTMRTIFGLVEPDAGSVSWDGGPVTPAMRRQFGYMPEERGLYPRMRIRDQVAYMGRLHGMSAADALAGADHWLERFGLGERSGDPLESLSHGNQQRVQLAVALVHDPDLLVLDEPFAGLDPIAADTMSDVLVEQARSGKAVVFSSHQLDVVEDLCDDVVIVNAGSVVVEGVVKELKDAAPIRHIEIEIEGASDDLLADLGGMRHVSRSGDTFTAVVDAATDVRSIFARAETSGPVRSFTYAPPSLTDLFREAVS
ncbi:MAG: ATP-binding cassette domain-containing protein [Acidimicrobiia bacterium]|nr:ATP-binding cassette domain-containing protein [Acidimicrobiia bacterium]